MCSCEKHSNTTSETSAAHAHDSLAFRVDDMTCGHCAGTIKTAIESNVPHAVVEADPVTKIVRVSGSANRTAIESMIVQAGYTPAEMAVPA